MAKVQGPLLSLDARGNFAGTLTYSGIGKMNVAKRKKVSVAPNDPKTPIQIFNREFFGDTVAIWQSLDLLQKQTLDKLGESMAYSGYNHFMKLYRKRCPTECGNTRCGLSELGELTY